MLFSVYVCDYVWSENTLSEPLTEPPELSLVHFTF